MGAYVDAAGDPVRAASAVRKAQPDPEKAAAALTQAELRTRAVAKFGDLAPHMFFTPDALEQATRLRVAEHRAARLAAAQPGSVIDLGCGIGGDLIAFARAGPHRSRRRPRPGARRGRPGQPRRTGPARRGRGRRRVGDRPQRVRRRLRRSRPPRRARPGLRCRRLDAAVVVRARPARRPWRRQGRAGHPAPPDPRRRRGRVGQRRGRREGGGVVGAGLRDHRPPRHRDR